MDHIERVLAARALEVGVEIRRGVGVEGFEAANDEVVVRAGDERIRAPWLVGCDGGRSTVRKHGGFELVGTEPEFTGYSVEVELADPSILPLGRHYTEAGMYTQWQAGTHSESPTSMAAHSIAYNRSRASTYKRCCGACPAQT